MQPVVVLTEADLRPLVGFSPTSLAAVEAAFVALSRGDAVMPPIMHLSVADPPGDIDIKSAYLKRKSYVAVKVASGFFSNRLRGLPSSSAMVVLLSAATGRCEAVLLDNGYLTDLRTGLAGAAAAKQLAVPGRIAAGIIGTGAQARYQLQGLALVRELELVRVVGRDGDRTKAYASEMTALLGVPVRVCHTVEEVVKESQVIVTTTPSTTPLIEAVWLGSGQHVTAVGSDAPGKRELSLDVLQVADRVVCDSVAQCTLAGELQGLRPKQIARLAPMTLGSVIAGTALGRRDSGDLTICDLTGTGAQDAAIAEIALAAARAAGVGRVLDPAAPPP